MRVNVQKFIFGVSALQILLGVSGCDSALDDTGTTFSGMDQNSLGDHPLQGDTHYGSYSLYGSLEQLSDCQEVKDFIVGRALDQLQEEYSSYVRQAENDYTYDYITTGSARGPEVTVMEEASAGGSGDSANTVKEYTTTNIQVEGVDEPDIVKNTSDTIYHLTNNVLKIIKSWPASEFSILSTTEVEGSARDLLLDDYLKQVVVFSQVYSYGDGYIGIPEPFFLGSSPFYPAQDLSYVKVTVIDVSDKENPSVSYSYEIPGNYQEARMIGSIIHLVTKNYSPRIELVDWSINWEASKDERLKELKDKLAVNQGLVRQQDLSFWLQEDGFKKVVSSDNTVTITNEGCQNIYAPSIPSDEGYTRILSLDLNSEVLSKTLLLASSHTVYSSFQSIYLLMPRWWWSTEEKTLDSTFIHKFSIDGSDTSYEASGKVDGQILNSFSVDEHEDSLRIATTIRQLEEDGSGDEVFSSINTVNRISILQQQNNELKVVGQTEDLAQGERIYSARFMGRRGYVVTFRQVDPLYSLDLSDPTDPLVKGELKIPGFSSYIHPVGDSHLLTIGRDADPVSGQVEGLKISVFDVSNLEDPQEVNHVIETSSYWSEAQYDHHAFTFLHSKKILAIPVSGYNYGSFTSKVLLYNLDDSFQVSKKGEVDYANNFENRYQAAHRNIFMVDGLSNILLYTLGASGSQILDLENLEEVIGRLTY